MKTDRWRSPINSTPGPGKKSGKRPSPAAFPTNGARVRGAPFVDGDRVYVQSCSGEFRCLNFADGKILWAASFEKDFGVKFLGSKAEGRRRFPAWQ